MPPRSHQSHNTLAKSSIIPSTISSTDFKNIKLGNANNGTTSFFYLNVIPYIDNDLTQYSGINKVILKGTVIDNVTNQETKIEKTIEYNVDSYSQDMNASILSATAKSDEEYSTKVIYEITTQENDGLTPVKAAYITGSISDLKGQHPVEGLSFERIGWRRISLYLIDSRLYLVPPLKAFLP